MNVLITGSREWTDRDLMRRVLVRELTALDPSLAADVTVMHGACRGADLMAARLLNTSVYKVRAFPADWQTHGKRAGILRNLQMLDEGPVLVLAFQVGRSRGTQHVIDEARKRNIPVVVTEAGS